MLVILATHPIQYQAPLFQALAKNTSIPFEVWYLTSHGVKSTLDSEFGKSFSWDIDLFSGYKYCFPPNEPKDLKGFWKVGLPSYYINKLSSGQVSALFVAGWNVRACWQAVWLAKKNGIPVWMRGDSNDLKKDNFVKAVVKRTVLSIYFKGISKFLCVGKSNRRLYESYGINNSRLEFAPHAVDNDRFFNDRNRLFPSRKDIRNNWCIPDNAFCLLFVGKFVDIKRPLDILKAVELLNLNNPKFLFHVLFVGTGELGLKLRNQVKIAFDVDANLKTNLPQTNQNSVGASFTGFLNQSEISKAYVAADVLILSSKSETWGLVVNEALSSLLPAIVSDSCGCAEDLISPLAPSLVYQSGNILDLSRSILYAISNPTAPENIKSVISSYSYKTTTDLIEYLWSRLDKNYTV